MNLLKDMERSLQEGDSYAVFTERDPKSGEVIVYGKPRRWALTTEWGVIIGDIVHNLRSVLDHLVWALTVANQPEWPPNPVPDAGLGSEWKNLGFPIYMEDRRKRDSNGNRIPWETAPPKGLWGVDKNLRAQFEELQPFKRKKNPAFVQLGTADSSYAPLAILPHLRHGGAKGRRGLRGIPHRGEAHKGSRDTRRTGHGIEREGWLGVCSEGSNGGVISPQISTGGTRDASVREARR